MLQLKENSGSVKTPPGRLQAAHSSKVSSSASPLERRPLIEISNKLHAMVDEFVQNMTSECDILANNISTKAGSYAARNSGAEPTSTPRLSNRTTTEVLNGLRRPSGDHSNSPQTTEGKSRLEHGMSNLQGGNTANREGGRFVRQAREKKPNSATLEDDNIQKDVTSVEISSENTLSKDEAQHGRGTPDIASIGKTIQSIEILSSDHSSDDGLGTSMKYSRKMVGNQNSTKFRKPSWQGRPTETEKKTPSRSPSSSHLMDIGYEEDVHSPGVKSPHIESPFMKLRWPKNVETVHSGGIGKRNTNNSEPGLSEARKKNDRKKAFDDVPLHEGDDSDEEDTDGNENGESDGEELPVLPKVPVKRKLMSESKGAERSSQRGPTKSGNPLTKKQRTPQIDASVIRQLEFAQRPQNCVSTVAVALCVFP
jgi:hypothetical protein